MRKKGTIHYGDLVEYVHFKGTQYMDYMQMLSLSKWFASQSKLKIGRGNDQEADGMAIVCREIYESMVNLNTLILESAKAFFPFQQVVNGKSMPTHFLKHSLKYLHIPIWSD